MLPDPKSVGKLYKKKSFVWAVQVNKDFSVSTAHGLVFAKAGDYLAEDENGDRWPIKAEVFKTIYEEINLTDLHPETPIPPHYARRVD